MYSLSDVSTKLHLSSDHDTFTNWCMYCSAFERWCHLLLMYVLNCIWTVMHSPPDACSEDHLNDDAFTYRCTYWIAFEQWCLHCLMHAVKTIVSVMHSLPDVCNKDHLNNGALTYWCTYCSAFEQWCLHCLMHAVKTIWTAMQHAVKTIWSVMHSLPDVCSENQFNVDAFTYWCTYRTASEQWSWCLH